jgi:hypothetical protein
MISRGVPRGTASRRSPEISGPGSLTLNLLRDQSFTRNGTEGSNPALRHPVCLCCAFLGSTLKRAALRAVSETKWTGERAGLGRIRLGRRPFL